MGAYAYNCHYFDEVTIQRYLWGRRCDYFDTTITDMLLAKLKTTIDPEIWESVLATTGEDFETAQCTLKHQIESVDYKMQTLLSNFTPLTSPTLIKALEEEYSRFEDEKRRLEQKLEQITELAKDQQAENVIAHWNEMSAQERRTVIRAFISHIIVTPTHKKRFADIEICWRDNSSDVFKLRYRADKYTMWSPNEIAALQESIERKASQIEIAQALPKRNWRAIRIKAYEIVDRRSFQISPKPIRDGETYTQYLERIEQNGSYRRHNSVPWKPEEIESLCELLDRGATQLEIAAALPYRSWQGLRQKIRDLRGEKFKVPGPRPIGKHETFTEYVERDPSGAQSMPFLISKNSSPRSRC